MTSTNINKMTLSNEHFVSREVTQHKYVEEVACTFKCKS